MTNYHLSPDIYHLDGCMTNCHLSPDTYHLEGSPA